MTYMTNNTVKQQKLAKCKCGKSYANKDGVVTYYGSKNGGWHCLSCQITGK